MRKESEMPRIGIIGLISLLLSIVLIGITKYYSNFPKFHYLIFLSCFLYALFIAFLVLLLYSEAISKIRFEAFPNKNKFESNENIYDEINSNERLHCPFCNNIVTNYWEICPKCGKSIGTVSPLVLAPLKGKILAVVLVIGILGWYGYGVVARMDYDRGTDVVNELIEESTLEMVEYKRIVLTYNKEVELLYNDINRIQINPNASDEEIENTLEKYDKITKERYDELTKIQYEMDFLLSSTKEKLEEANKIPLQEWQKDIIELKMESIDIEKERNIILAQAIYNEAFVYRRSLLTLNCAQTYLMRTVPSYDIFRDPVDQMIPIFKKSIAENRGDYAKTMMTIYRINKIIKLNSINDILTDIRCNMNNEEKCMQYLDALENRDYKKANEIRVELLFEKCQEYHLNEVHEELNEWYKSNSENNYLKSTDLYKESEKLWWESEKIRVDKKFS